MPETDELRAYLFIALGGVIAAPIFLHIGEPTYLAFWMIAAVGIGQLFSIGYRRMVERGGQNA